MRSPRTSCRLEAALAGSARAPACRTRHTAWRNAAPAARLAFGRIAEGLFPGLVACLVAAASAAAQTDPLVLSAHTVEPRAFGHRAGDLLDREVHVDVPEGLVLDESSLPAPGALGVALELRSVERVHAALDGGAPLQLRLRYQVFAAPPTPRVYELPPFVLRFGGGERVQELRVDAWPLVVTPLATEEVAYRSGLGEMQPDTPPPLRGTRIERAVLWACAALAALLAAYLWLVYVGLPGWQRRRRPFQRAWRTVRAQRDGDWATSCRALHAAFDQTAGRTVFADAVGAFVAQAPRFAGLRDDIEHFYARSQAAFFGAADAVVPTAQWLTEFARACRDAERGSS